MKNYRIQDLRPTQFVLGMKEVASKVEKFGKMDKKALAAYFHDHKIPIVLGPGDQAYMIDHHHLVRACWESQIEGFVVKVVEDLSGAKEGDFWNEMRKKDWAYLHDQFGLGPHSPSALPGDIRGLADDPFRSLAWMVREEGGFEKVETPFFEFKWASFFRANLETHLYSKSDFAQALKGAMKLSRSAGASHLPGFKK